MTILETVGVPPGHMYAGVGECPIMNLFLVWSYQISMHLEIFHPVGPGGGEGVMHLSLDLFGTEGHSFSSGQGYNMVKPTNKV